MPFCPSCGCEFVEGTAMCSDCRVPLEAEKREPRETRETQPVWLMDVSDTFEYMMLRAVLDEAGIPHLRRFYEASGELMELYSGRSDFRAAIYVPEELRERAAELLFGGDAGEAGAQE